MRDRERLERERERETAAEHSREMIGGAGGNAPRPWAGPPLLPSWSAYLRHQPAPRHHPVLCRYVAASHSFSPRHLHLLLFSRHLFTLEVGVSKVVES